MKNKSLFMLVVLCASLQLHSSAGPEQQSWSNWLYSKFKKLQVGTVLRNPMVRSGAVGFVAQASGLDPSMISDVMDYFVIVVDDILPVLASYRSGSVDRAKSVKKIENDLSVVVSNSLLYPTRSSKIHVLLKKDEFLQYVNDQDGVVQEACNLLIRKINSIPYPETQKEKNRVIDEKMAEARGVISSFRTVDDQIKGLEDYLKQKQGFEVLTMQAYLSVYFRLKNRQKVEGKLTQEEKSAQQPWVFKPEKVLKQETKTTPTEAPLMQ